MATPTLRTPMADGSGLYTVRNQGSGPGSIDVRGFEVFLLQVQPAGALTGQPVQRIEIIEGQITVVGRSVTL